MADLTEEDKLHSLRHKAHKHFDTLWMSGKMSRSTAYTWLSIKMKKRPELCHMKLFDTNELHRVIQLVEDFK